MADLDLSTYEFQLSQVNAALAADPDNAELKNLQSELQSLIDLTKQLEGASSSSSAAPAPAASSSRSKAASPLHDAKQASASPKPERDAPPKPQPPAHRFTAGEEVSAKYNGDGRWYPARIVSVGGSVLKPVYSIVFKGYKTTELADAQSVRPLKGPSTSNAESGAGAASSSSGAKRGAPIQLTPEEEAERERKKKRSEKKAERRETKTQEAQSKASSWQKFAKKGAKKGYGIAGLEGKSMFATPDDPLAKVGVVGAGRGMTKSDSRKRHVYDGA